MQVHPQQISPGENFDLFYFIRNHTDATTYYVRAVIYDVRSGDVLGTATLTREATNTRLFAATVQAPPDPAGYGRNIVAIATVYTDSGYTSKSTDYEEQEQYFLIKPVVPIIGGGVDYHALREMMEEVVTKKLSGLDKPQRFPVDSLFGAIGALQREINRIPKEAADIEAILRAVASIKSEIKKLSTTDELAEISGKLDNVLTAIGEIPPADLSPVKDASKATTAAIDGLKRDMQSALGVFLTSYEEQLRDLSKNALDGFQKAATETLSKKGLKFSIDQYDGKRLDEPQASPIDVSHLYAK